MKPANVLLICSDEHDPRFDRQLHYRDGRDDPGFDRQYQPMHIQNAVGLMGLGGTP